MNVEERERERRERERERRKEYNALRYCLQELSEQ